MISKKLYPLVAIALAVAAVSCKDKDNDTALPYLDGTLTFSGVDDFILYKTGSNGKPYEYKLVPSGITHPEGRGFGYKWKVTPGMDDYHTSRDENEDPSEASGEFWWGPKDTIATFSVTCITSATDYSSSSATRYVTMVKPGIGEKCSLQKTGIKTSDPYFTDSRDARKYYTVTVGSQTWMRQNLAYSGKDNGTGIPYLDAEAMTDIFGRYYTWDEAKSACPEGWHLPTDAEWTALAKEVTGIEGLEELTDWEDGNAKISRKFMAGEKFDKPASTGQIAESATFNTDNVMWKYYPEVGDPTNESGISALSAGYATIGAQKNTFSGIYEFAAFWTANEDGDSAYCRIINRENPAVTISRHYKESFAASVRCVKD